MTEQQKQAWRDYFSQLRQYQLDLNSYYYDLVEYVSGASTQDDDDDDGPGSNPIPQPPTPPPPPGLPPKP